MTKVELAQDGVVIQGVTADVRERSRNVAPDRAWSAVLYSCVLPYVIGVVVMLALWAL